MPPPPRVLCFTLPILGHETPLLPVLTELASRDARVQVVTSEARVATVMEAGCEVVATYPEAFSRAVRAMPENFVVVAALLARWTERVLLAEARRVVRAWAPDVVVVDSMAPWGRLAAMERGIPVVTSSPSFLIDRRVAGLRGTARGLGRAGRAPRAMAEIVRSRSNLRIRAGVDCGGPLTLLSNRGAATLVHTAPALQPQAARFGDDVHFVGPAAAGRPAPSVEAGSALAEVLRAADEGQPLAYVALGTIYHDRPAFLTAAAEALTALDYRVVVAVGDDGGRDAVGALPPGALCLAMPPQLAILDRASLFVTHGGLGSVHEALWRSVPMVVFPQAADQPIVAARLAALGAAQVLREADPDARAIRGAATRAASPETRLAAQRLGAQLRACGLAPAAADVILELARPGRAHAHGAVEGAWPRGPEPI